MVLDGGSRSRRRKSVEEVAEETGRREEGVYAQTGSELISLVRMGQEIAKDT